MDVRSSWAWRGLVTWAKYNLPWICHLCGQRIPTHASRFSPLSYALDHKLTVSDHPELALSKDNVAPSHKRCNESRSNRPLTPGLILEITEKYANRVPTALNFFDSSTETLDNE